MNSRTLQRWQDRQKGRALKVIKELAQRIIREELIVKDVGFWVGASNDITFRFIVVSRDSEKDSESFEKLL